MDGGGVGLAGRAALTGRRTGGDCRGSLTVVYASEGVVYGEKGRASRGCAVDSVKVGCASSSSLCRRRGLGAAWASGGGSGGIVVGWRWIARRCLHGAERESVGFGDGLLVCLALLSATAPAALLRYCTSCPQPPCRLPRCHPRCSFSHSGQYHFTDLGTAFSPTHARWN